MKTGLASSAEVWYNEAGNETERSGKMRTFFKNNLRYLILILAAASCAFGMWRGETATVFRKAAAVCLECIGIG